MTQYYNNYGPSEFQSSLPTSCPTPPQYYDPTNYNHFSFYSATQNNLATLPKASTDCQYAQNPSMDYYHQPQFSSQTPLQNNGGQDQSQFCGQIDYDQSYYAAQNNYSIDVNGHYENYFLEQNNNGQSQQGGVYSGDVYEEEGYGQGQVQGEDLFVASQQIGQKLQEQKLEDKQNDFDDGLSKMAQLWIGPPCGLKYQYEIGNQDYLTRNSEYQQIQQFSNSTSEQYEQSYRAPYTRSVSKQQVRQFIIQVKCMLKYMMQSYRLDDEGAGLLNLSKQDYRRALEELRRQVQNLYGEAINNYQ